MAIHGALRFATINPQIAGSLGYQLSKAIFRGNRDCCAVQQTDCLATNARMLGAQMKRRYQINFSMSCRVVVAGPAHCSYNAALDKIS